MEDNNMKFVYHTIQQLHDLNCSTVPKDSGIYVIDIPKGFQVKFKNTTTAIEVFNGHSMLYPAEELQEKYEQSDKRRLYIGKAAGTNGLRQRLRQMIQYGWRNATNKRGGRAIWQIENCYELLEGYFICENPRIKETELLNKYIEDYKVMPVANWVR